jgi:hypothetical protein
MPYAAGQRRAAGDEGERDGTRARGRQTTGPLGDERAKGQGMIHEQRRLVGCSAARGVGSHHSSPAAGSCGLLAQALWPTGECRLSQVAELHTGLKKRAVCLGCVAHLGMRGASLSRRLQSPACPQAHTAALGAGRPTGAAPSASRRAPRRSNHAGTPGRLERIGLPAAGTSTATPPRCCIAHGVASGRSRGRGANTMHGLPRGRPHCAASRRALAFKAGIPQRGRSARRLVSSRRAVALLLGGQALEQVLVLAPRHKACGGLRRIWVQAAAGSVWHATVAGLPGRFPTAIASGFP